MDLKELLGEELYNQVIAKAGDNKVDIVSDGRWIPKDKFDQVNEDKKTYKKQVDDLNTDLGKLKGQLKDNEEAQNTIKTLQDTIANNENKIKEVQKEAAIKIALKDAKAKDPLDILPHLKKDSIEVGEDGTVKGLDEQIKTLKEAKSYMFEIEDNSGGTGGTGNFGKKKNGDGDESIGVRLAKQNEESSKNNSEATQHYFK